MGLEIGQRVNGGKRVGSDEDGVKILAKHKVSGVLG
jgi:hypothetical protein